MLAAIMPFQEGWVKWLALDDPIPDDEPIFEQDFLQNGANVKPTLVNMEPLTCHVINPCIVSGVNGLQSNVTIFKKRLEPKNNLITESQQVIFLFKIPYSTIFKNEGFWLPKGGAPQPKSRSSLYHVLLHVFSKIHTP